MADKMPHNQLVHSWRARVNPRGRSLLKIQLAGGRRQQAVCLENELAGSSWQRAARLGGRRQRAAIDKLAVGSLLLVVCLERAGSGQVAVRSEKSWQVAAGSSQQTRKLQRPAGGKDK